MINLMYLVFIAMMALNVSSDVLSGFDKVNTSLETSIEGAQQKNASLLYQINAAKVKNPQKAEKWYEKSIAINAQADSLCNYINHIKSQIITETGGVGNDIASMKRQDDLEAANVVLLNPLHGKGKNLRNKINAYRSLVGQYIKRNEERVSTLDKALSTEPKGLKSWENDTFENMPAIAAITLLTKIQNDVRTVESFALDEIFKSIDMGDIRVNRIEAQIIPESRTVIQGGSFKGQIVLSSIDSTQFPDIYVGNKMLSKDADGRFSIAATQIGTFPISGHVELKAPDGSILKREFRTEYSVSAPVASIAPTMMNVLYAGIENPVTIAVPGVASGDIIATMSNGQLTKKGNNWIAKPLKIGQEALINVSIKQPNGTISKIASTSFRVRRLPDPTPYIPLKDDKGNPIRFKGGAISKRALLATTGIGAAIDDDIIDVQYRVKSFSIKFFDSLGNTIPEVSNSSNFSDRQRRMLSNLQRGKSIYITDIVATGPDGIDRKISPIELIIN